MLTGCNDVEIAKGCALPGICPKQPGGVMPSGFTNNTGWVDMNTCCDICEGAKRVNCLNPATCGQKTGNDDWDFLVFDQIWLPQLCAAFDQGHDPTLTHAPGTQCSTRTRRRSGLSIHGLWPNYVGGWPQCCNSVAMTPSMLPADLQLLAEEEWVDPAWRDGDDCSFCGMWAHEHMKHGTCLADDMASYFNATLMLNKRQRNVTEAVEAVLNQAAGQLLATAKIAAAFAPRTVEVVCDPKDPMANSTVGVFLELRSCWQRGPGFTRQQPHATLLEQVDCVVSRPTCPDLVMVSRPSFSRTVAFV